MRTLRFLHALPIPARNALRKLGADFRDARWRHAGACFLRARDSQVYVLLA
jgi:hypothetical protein